MTDLLLRPEDTGDIPRPADPGMTTQRLRADIPTAVFPVVVRSAFGEPGEARQPVTIGIVDQPRTDRPTVVLDLITDHQRIVPDGEDILRPGDPGYMPPQQPPTPDPVPPPPPPTPSSLWVHEPVRLPRGRHRRPSRWDWLTTPLSAAVQIIKAAL